MANEREKSQLDLHIAEYNALTNRCTNFLVIKFLVLGSLIAFVIYLFQYWNPSKERWYLWGGILGIQLLLWLIIIMVKEQFLAVEYIENNLRKMIEHELPGKTKFWEYERFLKDLRKGKKLQYEEDTFKFGIWIIVVIGIAYRIISSFWFQKNEWKLFDYLGITIVCFLAVLIFLNCQELSRIRSRFIVDKNNK